MVTAILKDHLQGQAIQEKWHSPNDTESHPWRVKSSATMLWEHQTLCKNYNIWLKKIHKISLSLQAASLHTTKKKDGYIVLSHCAKGREERNSCFKVWWKKVPEIWITVLQNVTSHSLVNTCQHSRRNMVLPPSLNKSFFYPGDNGSRSSKMVVNIHQTAWCNNLEDQTLNTLYTGNVKYHRVIFVAGRLLC